jgi:23S rRNA G2069 N7-methylase RlmK/C1962 C5-methylase RlmI
MTDGFITPPVEPEAVTPPDPVQERLANKDAFINQLQEELAGVREALKAKDVEVEAQRLLREAREAANPAPPKEATPASKEPAKPLNEDELVERVIKAQEQRVATARAEANAKAVGERLVELYGSPDAVNKLVADRATELGVSVQYLQDTASKSPNAFYELMKLETAPKQAAAPRGDVNPAALTNHAPGVKEGSNAYYEKLRLQIGDVAYYKPKIQQQRFKDAQRLGDAFFT